MGSEPWRAWPFAVGLALRGLLAGSLIWGAVQLSLGPGYYATALVLVGLALVAMADLVRRAGVAERALRTFAEGLAAGAVERPAHKLPGLDVITAIERAADRLDADRLAGQRRIDGLEALIDTVGAALFVLAPDGRIEFVNRAARALAREDADRLERLSVIGPELAAQLTGLSPGAREVVRLANGRAALAVAAAYRLPGGERRRLISLQTIAGELDAVELKAWRDLTRILAHEMMNSLTPIVSLAESLDAMLGRQETADLGEVASAVQVIARRSAGLMSFVDRYRKIADLPPPTLAPVRLTELVAGLERLFEPMLKDRGIVLRNSIAPAGLTLLVDSELIEQAMLNLLKNAVEAVADVEAPAIGMACRLDDGGAATISVSDNGRGLPEDADALFLPFFTTKAGGSGIGLGVVRQVALAHQGRVVASSSDRGAVFSLILPPQCVVG